MSDTISAEQVNRLRKEFREYLRQSHPEWKDSTVSTVASDAFYALNNNVGVDFWESLESEDSLRIVSHAIRGYLERTADVTRARERVEGYLSALGHFKTFIDEKHPTLPEDWKGKSMSQGNLKSDFAAWMKKQKKDSGEAYSKNTINTYAAALRSTTAKLHLEEPLRGDLFTYTSLDDFLRAYTIIQRAPNLKEVEAAAGNKAYSRGMLLYKGFLEELEQPSVWIFQGNPKYYDVLGAVESLEQLTWAANQYSKRIKRGDKVYIWISGSEGGIAASGKILCDPELRDPNEKDPYLRGEPLKTEPYRAVDIRILRRFPPQKVTRIRLLEDERTKGLEILAYPGATNFPVTKAQEEVIESMLSESYKPVPVKNDDEDEEVLSKRRYWIFSPGPRAREWEEFVSQEIMGILWDELGDLARFGSKEEIKIAMREKYDPSRSYINDGLALWQFAHEIAEGDIVYAKRGTDTILGRGMVTSDYFYDVNRSEYRHLHKVNWEHRGEWEHPGQVAVKTLTDITPYTEYVAQLEALILGEIKEESPVLYSAYTEEDFLKEVFLCPESYKKLKGLLLRKKNVILQGPPGVGKTFAARRLAFSIMGEKDINRIKMVQFHQSYSYEDFVMGYRPDGSGFRLAEGPFYKFCKTAEGDDERPYFFIIDEINRGNLSKIFGELLMLMESDKRGEGHALRLLYKDEQFSIPPNVHILGMMNTADRSLAMMDYALRRRFAFFDMPPAFASPGFKDHQLRQQNPSLDALIAMVEQLNKVIGEDSSLGEGFRIGHSYFCTPGLYGPEWIDSVVEYELLPLLQEYWFDEPSKIEDWSARLRRALHGGEY